jgi:6-phosphogluconolactonase (cycloisomerase 2 family)
MKFSKLSQLFLVSSIGLLVATLLTACQIVTIDYVFVASSAGSGTSSNGQIDIFAVDSESGALRQGAPAADSGGIDPVSLAVTSDYANLYVANQGTSTTSPTIAHFTIGLNGALTAKDTITLTQPAVALAANASNTSLSAVSGATGATAATLTAYPLSKGAIGAAASQAALAIPGYGGDTVVPTGVTVLANGGAVYATVYDQSAYNPGGSTTSTANPGWVFGSVVGSGGALGAPTAYKAGVKPSGIAADPTNRFVYVTDYASSQLIGYTIESGSTLNFLINGPFKTGNEPSAVVIDPRGKYIYVSNALDSTVSAYAIDLSTGTPSIAVSTTGTGSNSTGSQPQGIAVDPALGRFVYTANYLDNSLSGFSLNPNSGTLTPTQAAPYPTGSKPTALVMVPHGNHSIQSVTP